MTAAAADRNTPFAAGRMYIKGPYALTASITVYAGTIATVLNSTGLIVVAGDTANLIAVGFHMRRAVQADGDIPDVMGAAGWLANDGTITVANGVGRNATILDDQTVSLAATTTNDIVAGIIEAVDATLGVLVYIP